MSKHLAKDNAIWNRMIYGVSRQTIATTGEKSEKPPVYDEKRIEAEVPRTTTKRSGFMLKVVGVFMLVLYLLNSLGMEFGQVFSFTPYTGPVSVKPYGSFVDTGSFQDETEEPKEIIDVSYPFVPKAAYGKPVHSQVLIDHVFDSWGRPSLGKFIPPQNISYNKVVLTLNTSVSGVQYDRLGHLYVGGAEIWRTSTVEPGHKSVFSSHKKDVSPYVNLFHKNTEVVFQLDNLVRGNLTGAFHVQLYADFYLSDYLQSDSDNKTSVERGNSTYLDKKYHYFDFRKAADQIYPLVNENATLYPPIKHLPYEGLTVALPKVSQNTTRLKLSVFASGNAQEEFWYNNVVDKYTHRFENDGTVFHGHGPLRFVNVWVDGKKVASLAPQPFIFTGGYSPALWNSIVPVDAFDLPSIDLDISGLLPLLWDSEHHDLKILVDNGLDEVYGSFSGIGNDWIVSANLLSYENEEISLGSGEIVLIDDKKNVNVISISLPYTTSLQQIAGGKFGAEITANLVYKLKNGEVLNNTLTSTSESEISNIQIYKKLGRVGHHINEITSIKSFFLVDNLDDELIHSTEVVHRYPLTIVESEKVVLDGLDLNIDLVNGKHTTLKINDRVVMDESNVQNGTSTFHLRESGNYGSGNLDTDFKSFVSGPTRKYIYKRHVKAIEGEVTSDVVTFKNHEKEKGHEKKRGHKKEKDHGKKKSHRKHKCDDKKHKD